MSVNPKQTSVDLRRALKIEGWMDEADLAWLAGRAAEHRVIVEIGCFLGRSTAAMLDNSEAVVYAIDDFYGPREKEIHYTDEQRRVFFATFCLNMIDDIGSGRLAVFRKDHAEAGEIAAMLKPDMVFIDGSHEVEDVKRDIAMWRPRIVPGGLLCGHDYHWWPTVKRAVDEVIENPRIDPGTDIWYTTVEKPTYLIGNDGKSITCLICGMTSHNPNDVMYLYCGNCHDFHENLTRLVDS